MDWCSQRFRVRMRLESRHETNGCLLNSQGALLDESHKQKTLHVMNAPGSDILFTIPCDAFQVFLHPPWFEETARDSQADCVLKKCLSTSFCSTQKWFYMPKKSSKEFVTFLSFTASTDPLVAKISCGLLN